MERVTCPEPEELNGLGGWGVCHSHVEGNPVFVAAGFTLCVV